MNNMQRQEATPEQALENLNIYIEPQYKMSRVDYVNAHGSIIILRAALAELAELKKLKEEPAK